MKVGDIVKVLAAQGATGIIFAIDENCDWPHVMITSGRIVVWPKEQMELLIEAR